VQATGPDVAADTARDGPRSPLVALIALPLAVYGAVFAVLVVVSWQVISRYTETAQGVPPVSFRGEWFWDGWVRFDAGWYSIIADHGYSYTPGQQSPVAFFPGYPLLVWALSGLFDNTQLAGIALTIVCGAAALVAFHAWCRDRLDPAAATTAVLCLALYPYAYYLYGAMYGDALFLLCVLLAFLAFERDHLILAGLAGAAATATRLGRLQRRDAWVLLSVSGLAAWSLYLWNRFGDPLLFSTVQESWGQQSGVTTWIKRDFFATLYHRPSELYTQGLAFQALLGLAVVATIPAAIRRFGWRYGAYVGVLVLVPAVGSQDFQGLGRYLLGAFPAFAVAGALLAERPGVRRWVLPLSALVLVIFTGLFANGRYLS
jgi:hypothetical protein